MQKQERVELYEKMYFHELDRRDKIASRLSTPLGALIGAVGIVAYLLNNNPEIQSPVLGAAFWFLIAAAIITSLVGGWHFRKAWFGHTDRHVATAAEIDDYYSKLEERHSGQSNAPALIDADFEQFLLETYRRSATTNAINNDQRSLALYYAGCWLTSAIILSLLTTVPFYLGRGFEHDREQATAAPSTTAASTTGAPRQE